jgi:ABC-type transport system involved in multi-copper enzyme maturation permease subunit
MGAGEMLKALVWKEFRELLPMSAVALGVQMLLICYALNDWRIYHNASNVFATFPFLYIASMIFVLCAGLWQSARELTPNTYQFLLQRPVERTTVFGVKIGFGMLVCMVVGLAPSILFTAWMQDFVRRDDDYVHAVLGLCGGVWLIYFGALLSGLWPARWYGSRFYPLLAGILLYILLQSTYSMLDHLAWRPHDLFPLVGPILSIGFALAVLYVSRTRDFS